MRILKSNNTIFNNQVNILSDIFYGYKKFTPKMKTSMEKLGYEIYKAGKHIKCLYNGKLVTIISLSPSDINAGDNVIRCIRSFWEKTTFSSC